MKHSTIFLVLMAAAVSVALFVVKYRVQDLEAEFKDTNRQISAAEKDLHVLRAEWSHLNQPHRLRQLAGQYLEIGPLDAKRIGDAEHILGELSVREELAEAPEAELGEAGDKEVAQ
jgi:cell division protein FtsL